MRYSIDRIVEDIAVCEDENGGRVKLGTAELPAGAREGDILTEEAGVWKLDHEETDRRRQKMRKKLEGLIE